MNITGTLVFSIAAWIALLGTTRAVELSLPIACQPGLTCWIPRYVDLDPGPEAVDYRGGDQTGNDHQGTDFAVPNLAAMQRGVQVLAAAPGTVLAVRDGVPDINVLDPQAPNAKGVECGNGVLVGHQDGFETQYCHMMKGSLKVQRGEPVARGQELGLVGLSGDTSFPHLHLSVRKDGEIVDPFVGLHSDTRSTASLSLPLWQPDLRDQLAYEPVIIRNFGFADRQVTWTDIKQGRVDMRTTNGSLPALVIAFDGFRLHTGDQIASRINGPDGWSFEHQEEVERGRAQFMRFTGKKIGAGGLAPGEYEGTVTIVRPGQGVVASARRILKVR